MRICFVYDRLYPYTLGGAERWYRNLAERLAARGHDVTYVTLRHWDRDVVAEVPGVEVVTLGPKLDAYTDERRTVGPPLVFGACLLWHLLRRGSDYDVVHSASFPYFSVLAAAAARRLHGYRLTVDWHEVWTPAYWREYLGAIGGRIGWLVQRLCIRVRQRAFCFSRLHAERLREEGYRGEVTVLPGEYAGATERPKSAPAEPVVVYAGRHVPEKRVTALIPAIARARETLPDLRCDIFGDGPERGEVERLVREHRLEGAVTVHGFAPEEQVERALRRALCLVLPSRREGYGLVVVESSASGVPAVVVRDPDNAATELVDDGENGVIAPSAAPGDLAAAIVRIADAGPEMRERTADWFARNARRLSIEGSLETVAAAYAEPARGKAALAL